MTFAPGLSLRVIDRAGEPWFVAADVCRALELQSHPKFGFSRHLAKLAEDELLPLSATGGKLSGPGMHNAKVVSESGVYTLIMRSNKPEAQRFRKWVTSEVLPAIRKTGSYTVQAAPADPAQEDALQRPTGQPGRLTRSRPRSRTARRSPAAAIGPAAASLAQGHKPRTGPAATASGQCRLQPRHLHL